MPTLLQGKSMRGQFSPVQLQLPSAAVVTRPWLAAPKRPPPCNCLRAPFAACNSDVHAAPMTAAPQRRTGLLSRSPRLQAAGSRRPVPPINFWAGPRARASGTQQSADDLQAAIAVHMSSPRVSLLRSSMRRRSVD
eukprot:365203-Chlamydomonas_euryale.AAC.15